MTIRGLRELPGIALGEIDHELDESLEQVELAAAGVAFECAVLLDEGNGRKRAVLEIGEEVEHVLEMRRTLVGVGHDRLRILERVANAAIARREHPADNVV